MKMTRRDAIIKGSLGTLGVMSVAQTGPLLAVNHQEPKPGQNGKLTSLQINDSHGYLDLHLEWFAGLMEPSTAMPVVTPGLPHSQNASGRKQKARCYF